MNGQPDERKPILHDSGIYIKPGIVGALNQQHLVIHPIEFDHKHKNLYGYLSLGAFLLVLINYIMIKERSCQLSFANGFQNYDLIQSFHITSLIVSLVVFVLSYLNFATVILDIKLLFYTSTALIFACAGMLVYNVVAITSAPCVPLESPFANGVAGFLSVLDASKLTTGGDTVFSAQDGVGITVFFFDALAACLLFLAGRQFYKRS